MITRITDRIFTAAYSDLSNTDNHAFTGNQIIDVRHLVDKGGNDIGYIMDSVELAYQALNTGKAVVITCDMGISRSRVVAMALLTRLGQPVERSIQQVLEASGAPEINPDLLFQLRFHLSAKQSAASPLSGTLSVIGDDDYITRQLGVSLSDNLSSVTIPNRKKWDEEGGAAGLAAKLKCGGVETVVLCSQVDSHHSSDALATTLKLLKNTLDACRLAGSGLLFVSNTVVYQGTAYKSENIDLYVTDELPPEPKGTYSETMYLCEKLIDTYRKNYDIKVTVLRSSNIYGAGMGEQWLIPKLISKTLRNERVITHRYLNGYPRLELLHVRDFCAAVKLVTARELENRTLNAGSRESISTFDLARTIIKMCNGGGEHEILQISGDTRNVISCPGYLEKNGWNVAVSLQSGLMECSGSVKENKKQ